MSNPDPQSEVIDKILESFDTWDRCGRPDCQHNRNYVEAKSQILKLISEARIKALTDVDNLNLLNDSDIWHKFYLSQLSSTNSEGGEDENSYI